MDFLKKAQKATLSSPDDADLKLECQFNPHELKLTRNVTWGEGEQFLARYPSLQFTKAMHDTLEFELWFDESGESSDSSTIALAAAALNPMFAIAGQTIGPTNDNTVQEKLDTIYAMTTPQTWGSIEEKPPRPPFVTFEWAKFKFIGAIDKCGVNIKLFDDQGAPRRAKLTITMKGRLDWDPANAIKAPEKGKSMLPIDFK